MPTNDAGIDLTTILRDVKERIQEARTRAVLAVNSELVRLYWDIGRMLHDRQAREGWGKAVIPRLARELRNELPEVKGFSERNIGRMIAFYREYPVPSAILPEALAKSALPARPGGLSARSDDGGEASAPSLLWRLPWFHHVVLMERLKDLDLRHWYMTEALANGWSSSVLSLQIGASAHTRHGKAVTNFANMLPQPQSDLAQQALKDPYVFDFLTLTEPFQERELETELVRHLQKFLLELGQGFAFVGRQYRLPVGEEDFYVDLLFYHLRLRAFVVVDLKRGKFKPEYAGKLNFYCNAINGQLKHPDDGPTVGLLLCQHQSRLVAEYSLAGIDQPIGISTYELTRALPAQLKSALPTVEELEKELQPNPRVSLAKPKR